MPPRVDDVDLLPVALADVADPQVAGLAVEAPAPGIAEAERIDLRACLRARPVDVAERVAGERIAGSTAGYRRTASPRRARVHVDAQHLAEQALAGSARCRSGRRSRRRRRGRCRGIHPARRRCCPPLWLAASLSTVSRTRSEAGSSVRPPSGLVNSAVTERTARADQFAEVEVHAPVGRKVRVEGHAEQARLAFPMYHASRRSRTSAVGRHGRVVLERENPSALLDDVPARSVVRRLLHGDRRREVQARECARRLDACAARGRIGRIRRVATTAATAAAAGNRARSKTQQAIGCGASWQIPSVAADAQDPSDGAKFRRRRFQGRVVLSKAEAHEPCRQEAASQNGDRGMAATPCRRVSNSQNAASGRSDTAE